MMTRVFYEDFGNGVEMDWNIWIGKKVFLRTIRERVYSGVVQEVQDIGDGIMFLSFIDKFGEWVTVTTKEIAEIKEEGKKNAN